MMDWLPPRIFGSRNIWVVLFDGGVDSHEGQGGSGFVIVHHNTGRVVQWGFQYSGDYASNNIEEYRGMIAGLREVKRLKSHGDLVAVMGDSQLIVKHMNNECKIGWKLQYWHEIAMELSNGELVSFHWIRREVNAAADFLSKECRILRHWIEPRRARSESEWKVRLEEHMLNFNDLLDIMGSTIAIPCFYAASFRARVRRSFKAVLEEMALSHGHRLYFCMRPMKWIMIGSEQKGVITKHTGIEHHSRWQKEVQEVKPLRVTTSRTRTDMKEIARQAKQCTGELRDLGWDLTRLVKARRKEPSSRPNPSLQPRVYDTTLQGYGNLDMMKQIASSGVQVRMKEGFIAPRPWPGNFKIDPLALPLIHNDYAELFNQGKGLFVDMGPTGHFCDEMVVSPVGGVEKGGFPIWEKVRIINGLSTPMDRSINANTANVAPSACFGVVGELADRILNLKWHGVDNGVPSPIMGMSADIDAAFRQIPVSADSVKYFASRVPNTSILFLPFDLVFGWTSSPGYFAIFAKAVRHLQRTKGSWINGLWINFWTFVWVDDVVLIEPDTGSRLADSEWNIRESVETVFGPKGWKREKFETWSTRWKSLGLIWNTQSWTVEMPHDKLRKAADLLEKVAVSDSARVKTLQSLLGRLRHVIVCVPAAKSFVQRIQKLVNTAVWEGSEVVHNIGPCRRDFTFWKNRLSTVDFTAWPLEFFGTTGTVAAIWTVGILDGSPCVFWNGRNITYATCEYVRPGLAECIWMVLLAATEWLDIIRDMDIRAPRIMILLGRSDWSDGFNKGNVSKMHGQEALRQLAAFQMKNRISFLGKSWKAFGNSTPKGWNAIVNKAHNNTNVCQLGRRLENWMRLPCSWLCNPCVQKHIKSTRADSVLGRNSQNCTMNRYGFTNTVTRNNPSRWFDLLRIWPRCVRTSGGQSKARSARCALCTGCITTASWSRLVPSSPWWKRGDVCNWTDHDLGNQFPSQ